MPNPQNIVKHKFKKGQSGNPKGRPKVIPELKDILTDVLGKTDTKGISEIQKVFARLLERAKRGDVKAAEVLFDRTWGKAKQEIQSTNVNYNKELTKKERQKLDMTVLG